VNDAPPVADSNQEAEPVKAKVNWADPNIPPGDSPPMPLWPLVASAVAFGLWLVFLIAMAVVRIRTTPF
jgi:hypothetical protein